MKGPSIVDELRAGQAVPDQASRRVTAEPAIEAGKPVALIAFHGMGQQVRYGTIEETILMLFEGAKALGGKVELVGRRHLLDRTQLVACAELVVEARSRRIPVHVFETYWAPLTEGRISTWETFRFLFSSAIECAQNGRRFTRFLFEPHDPPKGEVMQATPWTIPGLILATLTMGALWVFDAVLLAIIASGIMVGGEPVWFRAMRHSLFSDYSAALLVPLASGLAFVIGSLLLKPLRKHAAWSVPLRAYARVGDIALKLTALWIVVVAADVLVTCLLAAVGRDKGLGLSAIPALSVLAPVVTTWVRWMNPFADSRLWLLAFGLALFAVSSTVRRFLRQYVGDVAIYVSSHKVNRFHETRVAIQQVACDVARFVYARRSGAAGNAWMYDRVVFMGHSLGSVIAYDTLNRLILEDGAGAEPLDTRRRTTALITYGSPLDKTAFIFRTQRRKDGSLREAMAAARQPLIQDPEARRMHWVNVFSPFDWIGGDLDFYDPKQGKHPACPVANIEDEHARTPLLAHSEHSEGPTLRGVVLDAVVDTLDANHQVQEALAKAGATGCRKLAPPATKARAAV